MFLANVNLSYFHTLAIQEAIAAVVAIAVTAGALYLLGFRRRSATPPALSREREEQVQLAFQAAHVGTWTWDHSSSEVFCDGQMKALYGLPQDRSVNYLDEFFARIHPDDVELVRRALEAAFANGPEYNMEFRVVRPDGSLHWIYARGAVTFDASGQPATMVGINMDIHTRKTAELALAESEHKFHTLADSIPQLAWMADPSGYRFWYNRRWYEYTGSTPEQMTGLGWRALHHPDDCGRVAALWQQSVANAQQLSLEYRLRGRDGSYRWFLKLATPIFDSLGQVFHWFGTDTDITETREARDALRESEDQFRQITDGMPQLVWVTRPDGYLLWWNRQWLSYSGVTIGPAGTDTWPDIFHVDDLPSVRERWNESLSSGKPFEVECRIRQSDGAYNWFLCRGEPVRDSDGNIVKWFGTNTSIEGYKQAQLNVRMVNERLGAANQDLAKAQAQLHSILNSGTQFLIIACDVHGLITVFNSGAERMLRYGASEVVGICTPEIFHLKAEVEERACAFARETGKPVHGFEVFAESALHGLTKEQEWTYIRKDGSTFEVTLAVTPIIQPDGAISGFFWFGIDITRQKSLERELRENNAKLSKQTARAEEANLAKSTFLAAMSHEIRTPMNAILGMSDLLWESNLDEDQRQYVEVFRRAGNVLLDLINSVLDLSKIEAGHLELECQLFDLEDVIVRTVELLSPRALAKGVRLFYGIGADVHTLLMGDAVRLQQVLVNLVGNAVKFTEAGEVVLRVYQDPTAGPGALDISVCDTGIGIPPDRLYSVFEDFTQADSSTTRKYGGTGLGLGISQRLIASMGGQLYVESQLGVGSVFHFTLALKPGVDRRETTRDNVNDLHGLSMVVIDNNETNCLILRETLTSWGVNSITCASAHEGSRELLRARNENSPHAMVILDCQMPDIDGFAAVPLLRQAHPGIPIVMLTSDNQMGDADKRARSGLSGYAVRPVKRADLLQLICNAVGVAPKVSHPLAEVAGAARRAVARPLETTNVLIAEDSPDNRLLLQVYLKNTAYVPTLADNGAQAIEQFMCGEFDLILMDMQMPIMDGLAATRAIRSYERAQGWPSVPILALTANALAHDTEASYKAGCNAHLSKPISKQKLLSALDTYGHALRDLLHSRPIWIAVPGELEEFAPKYLESRRLEMPALEQLLLASDFESIQKQAHDLKGTGASFGFGELSRLGAALESSAKERNADEIASQLRQMSNYLNRVQLSAPSHP